MSTGWTKKVDIEPIPYYKENCIVKNTLYFQYIIGREEMERGDWNLAWNMLKENPAHRKIRKERR